MQEPPVYEPDPAHSVAAEAARRGVPPEEAIYDMLTEGDGSRMFLVALASFPDMTLARAIRLLTGASADALGLTDRGRLEVGKKADINVIDLEAITLHVPRVVRDLPAGGSRLNQLADGYVATYVAGQCIARDGNPTDARPGRLVRAGASA